MPRRRAENPTPVFFSLGLLCGAAITFFEVGGRPIQEKPEFVELSDIEGAILLIGGKTAMDKTINLFTGSKGFAHCALYTGLIDQHKVPLLIESNYGSGVQLKPVTNYNKRPVALINLSYPDTIHARAIALRLLSNRTPYRGRPKGLTCAEFVAECLPRHLQNRINKRFPTPNDLALAFGVPEYDGLGENVTKDLQVENFNIRRKKR